MDVKSPSPGADAGLREHDVIVAVDGKPIRDIIGFRTALYDKEINDKMTLTFYRGTKKSNNNSEIRHSKVLKTGGPTSCFLLIEKVR